MSKTHWRKIIESDYLAGADLFSEDGTFKPIQVTIKRAGKEQILNQQTGKKESELLCYFHEIKKPMILNVTNSKAIEKLAGTPHIEDWVGLRVEIGTQKVKAFNEVWDALRIKPTKLGRAGEKRLPEGDMTADVLTGIKDHAIEVHGEAGAKALTDMIQHFGSGNWKALKLDQVAQYTAWVDSWKEGV